MIYLFNEDVNSLVVKIMTEKLNARYGSSLDKDQKSILREYVFSKSLGPNSRISAQLEKSKRDCLADLNSYKDQTENRTILEKIHEVSDRIQNESIGLVDDEKISKFLVIMQLKRELQEALNEQ